MLPTLSIRIHLAGGTECVCYFQKLSMEVALGVIYNDASTLHFMAAPIAKIMMVLYNVCVHSHCRKVLSV